MVLDILFFIGLIIGLLLLKGIDKHLKHLKRMYYYSNKEVLKRREMEFDLYE